MSSNDTINFKLTNYNTINSRLIMTMTINYNLLNITMIHNGNSI